MIMKNVHLVRWRSEPGKSEWFCLFENARLTKIDIPRYYYLVDTRIVCFWKGPGEHV